MRCPRCGGVTIGPKTRTTPDGRVVRIRLCKRPSCGRKFKTIEQRMATGDDYVPLPAPGLTRRRPA